MEVSSEEYQKVEDVISALRVMIQNDGGDLELLSFKNDMAKVQLGGHCASCHMAGQTLGGIRRQLTEVLGRPIRVFPAWKDE
jgi:NifU-like protein